MKRISFLLVFLFAFDDGITMKRGQKIKYKNHKNRKNTCIELRWNLRKSTFQIRERNFISGKIVKVWYTFHKDMIDMYLYDEDKLWNFFEEAIEPTLIKHDNWLENFEK